MVKKVSKKKRIKGPIWIALFGVPVRPSSTSKSGITIDGDDTHTLSLVECPFRGYKRQLIELNESYSFPMRFDEDRMPDWVITHIGYSETETGPVDKFFVLEDLMPIQHDSFIKEKHTLH